MKKYTVSIILLITFFSYFVMSARLLDVDQIRSSDRTKLWDLPVSSGTINTLTSVGTFTNKTISGGTNTFSDIPYTALSSMTSSQLGGIISDESGSGSLLFGTSPTITTPTITSGTSTNHVMVTPTLGAATGTSLALGSTLNASSILDLTSTSKGMLAPRMTQAQRDAIGTPATGLQIYNTDSNKLNVYNGTSWGEVGSGSSGVNYITDYDGSAIGSWTTYADAAASSPVDGTGGSPTITYAVSTNSDMRGTSNFLFSHGASNQQGQGFSYNFTIDPSDKGKVLQISLEYLIASGTYADDDLQFWIYDVTNAVLIQPAPFKLKNSGIIEKFAMEFQTSYNSTSYRLIAHVATTTATAYTIRFDNWSVGPQAKLYGSPITDWVSYTPTGSWVTNATYTGKWRRVGDELECQVLVTASGAVTAAVLSVNIPGGLSIDTSKIMSTNGDQQIVGFGVVLDSGVSAYTPATVHYSGTTSVRVAVSNTSSTYGVEASITNTTPITFGASDSVMINFKVPILGWSSSVVMSNDADTRVVSASLYRDSAFTYPASLGTTSKIQFNKTYSDSHGASGGTTADGSWVYTVPVSGYYRVSYSLPTESGSGTNSLFDTTVTIGAFSFTNRKYITSASSLDNSVGTFQGYATTGQTIYVSVASQYAGTAPTFNYGLGYAYLNIEKISGPSQIAASESVSASYFASGTQSINNNSTTAVTIFTNKIYDSHNAFNSATGVYTAPMSGKYSVKLFTASNGSIAAGTINNGFQSIITTSGSTPTTQAPMFAPTTTAMNYSALASNTFTLLAGQTVTLNSYSSLTGAAITIGSGIVPMYMAIERVGNY